MTVRVKICGIRTPEDATAAAEAGADFIGVVFAASPRKVDLSAARAIAAAVRPRPPTSLPRAIAGPRPGELAAAHALRAWAEAIDEALFRHRPLVVGVFADQPWQEVADIAAAVPVALVQLSGREEDDRTAEQLGLPVVRAVHVGEQDDPGEVVTRALSVHAALVLLDTADRERRGGTGRTLPWSVAATVAAELPIMLAGGLTPENVGAAIAEVVPWGVDVSSGVESNGRKDPARVAAFIRAAKGGGR